MVFYVSLYIKIEISEGIDSKNELVIMQILKYFVGIIFLSRNGYILGEWTLTLAAHHILHRCSPLPSLVKVFLSRLLIFFQKVNPVKGFNVFIFRFSRNPPQSKSDGAQQETLRLAPKLNPAYY